MEVFTGLQCLSNMGHLAIKSLDPNTVDGSIRSNIIRVKNKMFSAS